MKRQEHSYEELAKVAKRYYSDTNCCGVVALAAAAQVSFGKARATLRSKQHYAPRQHRKGTDMISLRSSLKWLGCTLENIHATPTWCELTKNSTGAVNCGLARYTEHRTLGKTCRQLPRKGVYLIHSTHHITCVIDGEIIDWAANTNKCRVTDVYKITRNFDQI
jgi:hypothetical protein